MIEINEIKKQVAELRRWACLPEKDEIAAVLKEAREFLLADQPNVAITPEGFYYRAADGTVQKVPPDHYWERATGQIVSVAEFERRHGVTSRMRYGCYPTQIFIDEP